MAKYALVVGISKYRDASISDLPYASRDAEGMGACLEADCEFEDVKVLKSRKGTNRVSSSDIGYELARIADAIGPDDTFVFYFAGHGVRSGGQSRLLTSDDTLRLPGLSMGYDQLRSGLAEVKCAQQVLIFDCCRGDPRHSRGGEQKLTSRGFVRDIKTLAKGDGGGAPATCVIFSCSEGQRAYEWPEKKHGVFTHFLLEGLSKKGWSGGRLVIQNVAAYVQKCVADWSKRRGQQQTPWSELSGTMDPVVLSEKLAKESPKQENASGWESGDVEFLKEITRRQFAEAEAERATEKAEKAQQAQAKAENQAADAAKRVAKAEKSAKQARERAASAEKSLRWSPPSSEAVKKDSKAAPLTPYRRRLEAAKKARQKNWEVVWACLGVLVALPLGVLLFILMIWYVILPGIKYVVFPLIQMTAEFLFECLKYLFS